MKNKTTRRWALLFLVAGAAAVLVACGGGQDDFDNREQASGLGAGSATSWTPGSIAFSMNPSGRQDIPVTFTTSVALTNVTVTVVPELRSIVSVSPTTFATLSVGQTATVTLTVAPSASESLRLVEGTVRIVVGTSTIAKPLPIKLTLVSPETINGIVVPPEPPADLNNATLAGFDINGNWVRDDVERLVARNFGTSGDRLADAMAFSRAEQRVLREGPGSPVNAYVQAFRCDRLDANETDPLTKNLVNTEARQMKFRVALAGLVLGKKECP